MKSFNYLFIYKPIYDIHLHQAKDNFIEKSIIFDAVFLNFLHL